MKGLKLIGFLAIFCLFAISTVSAKNTEKILVAFVQIGQYYGGDEKVDWLIPLLIYQKGRYQSCYQELERIFNDKKRKNQTKRSEEEAAIFLRPFQENKFYLYQKGRIVGEFKTSGSMDFDLPDGIGFPGKISWKIPRPRMGKEGFFTKAIGLNRLVDQPLWSKAVLTKEQYQELKKKEGKFNYYPVDIDGDGIAEFILERIIGPSKWEHYLYLIEKEKPVKILCLGEGGL